VDLIRDGSIYTYGDKSVGVFAQSIGGGGGNGGLAISGAFGGPQTKNIAGSLGGNGGSGGYSAKVFVDSSGYIQTTGAESYGILAQSIGGGGGTGGFSVSGALGIATEKTTHNLAISVGGSGGSGNYSGDVEVQNKSEIHTTGIEAVGVYAQSIGGGGGSGGGSFTGIVGLKGAGEGKSVNAQIVVGGQGGDGNYAGNVLVDSSGGISTKGDGAQGIRAQSIGGGGGSGGQANSLTLVLGQKKNKATGADDGPAPDPEKSNIDAKIIVGGFGGTGNNAGSVIVISDDYINTTGINAHGIYAQSIGGGGGAGGNAADGLDGYIPEETEIIESGIEKIIKKIAPAKTKEYSLTIGGGGGGSGNGNLVDITNDGSISVSGNTAWGIYAQSIGGGGGSGGNSAGGKSGTIGIGGGRLGELLGIESVTGDGGMIVVRNEFGANIHSSGGNFSGGIFAQSIGGGGGQGGAGSGKIGLGGNASAAGDGKKVDVENKGNIITEGLFSAGIMAQSVGGGGGTGGGGKLSLLSIGGEGGSSGNGGEVIVTNSGMIETLGFGSNGVFAQSVGGGGGVGGGLDEEKIDELDLPVVGIALLDLEAPTLPDINLVTLGGKGSSAGSGSNVKIDNNGQVVTRGGFSSGLLAQSVGGGGGYGGSGLGAVVLAGSAGASSNGGEVEIINGFGGSVYTFADFSNAIIAQSIGGGGGLSGNTIGAVVIGGKTSNGGNGGQVTVDNFGYVQTTGDNSTAIFAQSVGGGGGMVASATGLFAFGSDEGDGGDGGIVNVDNSGEIYTEGKNSHGIFAQSVGGGGGVVGDESSGSSAFKLAGSAGDGGNAGDVKIVNSADISALGENSVAILAQSDAGSGNGNLEIQINSGVIVGGFGEGAGVGFLDGKTNKLTNKGSLGAKGDNTGKEIAGLAVFGGAGDETIDNVGMLIGNARLGAGTNAFNNMDGGNVYSGANFDLGGALNLFTNNGFLAPGGSNSTETILTTELNGKYVQGTNGSFGVDLDFVSGDEAVGLADRLNISGTATLEGIIDLAIVNPNQANPGDHSLVIISAQNGADSLNLNLVAPSSAVANYSLSRPSSNDVVLDYSIDFAPDGVNSNQGAMGTYFNKLQLSGGSPTMAPLVGELFNLATLKELQAAYDAMSPEPYTQTFAGTLNSVGTFSNSLLSCKQYQGNYRFSAEGECGWIRLGAQYSSFDGTSKNFGFDERANKISGGLQWEINPNWYFGIGGSYEVTNADIASNISSEGSREQIGIVNKFVNQGTVLASTLVAGRGQFDMKRFVGLAAGGLAKGEQDITFFASQTKLSHTFELGQGYVRPAIDFTAVRIDQDSFTETGAGAANLRLDDITNNYAMISPSVEFGHESQIGSLEHRLHAKLGITHYLQGQNTVTAGFVGAPNGVPSFKTQGGFDDTLLDLEVGLDLIASNNATLQLGASAQIGENTNVLQTHLKFSIPF